MLLVDDEHIETQNIFFFPLKYITFLFLFPFVSRSLKDDVIQFLSEN
jgi:hypothetical protein